jgi:hypothetical protein
MEFGSEMLSVDHANISKRDIGNNRCISWTKQNFSKVGTVFAYLLSNDDLLLLFWFIWVYFLFILNI